MPDYDIEAELFDHHARTWASWTHTTFIRQAVACTAAVAAYGRSAYSARAEIRAQRGAAACPQRDLLADERALPVPMPVPTGAA